MKSTDDNNEITLEDLFESPAAFAQTDTTRVSLGRYELVRYIACGGMGEVWLARDTRLERDVALKLMRSDMLQDEVAVRRFRREARAMVRLTHPSIVTIYDIGSDEGRHFLVMELIEGENVQARTKRRGRLPLQEALAIIRQVVDALTYAHARGVIHRDIKPSNFMITPDHRVKLTDFGLARVATIDSRITPAGTMAASGAYMSPEQAKGREMIDHRCDIYSLGISFYEMLMGALPFPAADLLSAMHMHINEPFPEPEALRSMADGRVLALIKKACAKNPDDRYQSYAELAAAVQALVASEQAHIDEMDAPPAIPDEAVERVLKLLADAAAELNLAELRRMWRARRAEDWSYFSPRIYELMAERVISIGEPLFAYDILSEALAELSTDTAQSHVAADRTVRLRQLTALVLARSGASARAQELLLQLIKEGRATAASIGLLARTQKDLGLEAEITSRRDQYLTRAAEDYAAAYRLGTEQGQHADAIYAGVNAATLQLLRGNIEEAQQRAHEILMLCEDVIEETQAVTPHDYGVFAARAEAMLLLSRFKEAATLYRRAAQLGRGRWADVASTRRQAGLILKQLGRDEHELDECFGVPRVACFVGHMIDRPDRPTPRFPATMEATVRAQIRESIQRTGARIGFSSASCGSDLLFIEEMLDAGGEAHVILPFDVKEFRERSVDRIPGSDWPKRFDRALERAAEVHVVSRALGDFPTLFEFSSMYMDGLSNLKATFLQTDLICMAVWDGRPGDGPGGTATVVQHWLRQGRNTDMIDLTRLAHGVGGVPMAVAPSGPMDGQTQKLFIPQEIKAMLLAEVVGYEKLSDMQMPAFMQHVLLPIAQMSANFFVAYPSGLLEKKSWAGRMKFIFDDLPSAAYFATRLCAIFNRGDWAHAGLPSDINIRILLHAGPVYRSTDPLSGNASFAGSAITQLQRRDLRTPPGHVYATDSFSALAVSLGMPDFRFEYAGRMGSDGAEQGFALYHVTCTKIRKEERVIREERALR